MFIHNKKKKVVLSIINIAIDLFWGPGRLFQKRVDPRLINPSKILLVRLDHIGDVVMTSPSYTLMRERFPEAKIYLLTNEAGRQLYEGDPRIDEVRVFNWPWGQQRIREKFSRAKIQQLRKVISELRSEKIDLIVDFRGDLRFTMLFGVLTGIRIRVSNSRSGKSSLLHHMSDYDISKHEVERSLDVVRCFGDLKGEVRPSLYLRPNDIAEIKTVISDLVSEQELGKIAIAAPYSSRDVKSWPTSYFIEAITFLRQKGFMVLLVGTTNDREHSETITNQFEQGVYSLAGTTNVRQLAALVSLSEIVVGVDTGVLHIAACFDIPILALFGSTRAIEFRPYSPLAMVAESGTCTCNQFLHLRCSKAVEGYACCMSDLKPAPVIQAIESLIAQPRKEKVNAPAV